MFRSAPAALYVFLASAGVASADCRLVKLAELPVVMEGPRPVVAAEIDGHRVRLLVDSGSFSSLISPAAAARLGLRADLAARPSTIIGLGGAADVRRVIADTFTVDGFSDPGLGFLTAAPELFNDDVVGVLGQNFLAAFEVEYDLGAGAIRLFQPQGACTDTPRAYWSAAYSVLPLEPVSARDPHLVGAVSFDGRALRALFDTGAAASSLATSAGARAGVTPRSPGVTVAGDVGGIGPRTAQAWIVPVARLGVGPETIEHTRMRMADIALADGADMLIGADFFLSHRIYVATGQSRLYFTYDGGAVFDPWTTADGMRETVSAAPVAEAAPTDADGFARRGAAAAAREAFVDAIVDFSRAIVLDPTKAKYFHDRALAWFEADDRTQAMADLDEALRLKPDDAPSLMERGGLHLTLGDEPAAAADFDAAIAASTDPLLRLDAAEAYDRTGRYPAAVGQFDLWIAAHPTSDRLADALNDRCWVRAEGKIALDRALADCDAALALRPRTAEYLDSRGLVRLRRGELDRAIADYDAALKLQPRLAWSLYARGLAKQREGRAAEAAADLAAGAALDTGAPAQAQRLGLVPAGAAPATAKP